MRETPLIKFIMLFWYSTAIAVVVLPTLTVESTAWLLPMIVSAIFILIFVVILIADSLLSDYNIDLLGLILLLLFGTLLRFDTIANNSLGTILKVITWILAAVVGFRIISKQITFVYPNKGQIVYLLVGILSGLMLALVGAYFTVHRPGFHAQPVNPATYSSADYLVRALANAASYAAVPEEFIFRGLFLGYLVKKSYTVKRAYLIQGIFFWLSHFNYIFVSPIGFWLIIPTATLVFSLLAWRSRSLVASISAHTIFDTFQIVFAVMMMAHM